MDELNPQPIAPQQPPVEQPSRNWLKIVLLSLVGVFIAAGLVFTGYTLGTHSEKTLDPITQIAITPSPETASHPSPTINPTANWKTYTNTYYGYTLQYPTDNLVHIICPSTEKDNFYMALRSIYESLEESINMESCARDSRFTLQVEVYTGSPPIPTGEDSNYSIKKEDITVAGQPATKYTITSKPSCLGPCIEWETQVYVPYKNKTYAFFVNKKEVSDTLTQILSTFKFTQ